VTRISAKAVLFDVDGTLIDSTAAIVYATRLWAKEFGIDPDAAIEATWGCPSIEGIRKLIPPGLVRQAAVRLEMLEHRELDGIRFIPGAREFLAGLTSGGLPWGVVTSMTRSLLLRRAAAVGLRLPAVSVSADDVIEGKPSPEGYVACADALGVDVSRCLVFEDSDAGIAAGESAGASVICVGDAAALPASGMRIGTFDEVAFDGKTVTLSRQGDGHPAAAP